MSNDDILSSSGLNQNLHINKLNNQ